MKKFVFTLAMICMGWGAQAQSKKAAVAAKPVTYTYSIQEQLAGLDELNRLVKLEPAMYEALGQMMKTRAEALINLSHASSREKTLEVFAEKIKASLTPAQMNTLMQNKALWHKISLQ